MRSNSKEIGIPTGYDYLDNPAQFPIPDSSFRQTQPVARHRRRAREHVARHDRRDHRRDHPRNAGRDRPALGQLARRNPRVSMSRRCNIPLLLIIVFAYLGSRSLRSRASRSVATPRPRGDLESRRRRPSLDGTAWGIVLGIAIAYGAGCSSLPGAGRLLIAPAETHTSWLWTLTTGVAIVLVTCPADYALDIPELDGRIVTGGIRLSPEYFAICSRS